jgi:hypothetical protein
LHDFLESLQVHVEPERERERERETKIDTKIDTKSHFIEASS